MTPEDTAVFRITEYDYHGNKTVTYAATLDGPYAEYADVFADGTVKRTGSGGSDDEDDQSGIDIERLHHAPDSPIRFAEGVGAIEFPVLFHLKNVGDRGTLEKLAEAAREADAVNGNDEPIGGYTLEQALILVFHHVGTEGLWGTGILSGWTVERQPEPESWTDAKYPEADRLCPACGNSLDRESSVDDCPTNFHAHNARPEPTQPIKQAAHPQRLYVEDSEPVDITTAQAERLLITGLAQYVTPEDKGVKRLSDEDPGDLHLVTVYAVPGDTSPDFPFAADRWMWQIGDNWVAVADWEREDEWFEDLERDGIETPTPRVRELHDLPPHGTVTYRNSDYIEVVMTIRDATTGAVLPHHHRTDIVGQHLYGSHEREHVTAAHGLSESEQLRMSDRQVNTWHSQQRHAGVVLVETFGLTPIDAERLLRFAAAAAEAGILNDDAAWKCGFDTNPDGEISNTVVDVARRAAAFIKEHGL